MLVSLCLLCNNLNVHAKKKKKNLGHQEIHLAFKSVLQRLNYPILLLLCSYEFCCSKHISFEDKQVFLM